MQQTCENIPRNEGDYEKDGLLYCGKCHSPKQGKYFAEDGSYITPRILCDCEQEARNRKEEEVKREERIRYIDKLKRSGIQDRKLLNCSFEIDESPHSKYSKAFKEKLDFLKAKGYYIYTHSKALKKDNACISFRSIRVVGHCPS